jgi:hypothetical protein
MLDAPSLTLGVTPQRTVWLTPDTPYRACQLCDWGASNGARCKYPASDGRAAAARSCGPEAAHLRINGVRIALVTARRQDAARPHINGVRT